ncbi:MAG: hypothetical protein IKH44_02575 [Bacteroidales bacterium]|nr:hypothetical protein [Bacteroidales bacterium]
MEKYFICLANSYKHGGRCIAGIEVVPQSDGSLGIVRHDDGRPRWIRPVSMSANGEIPNHLAESFKIFSLVKLTDVEPCPDNAHTEDVHCTRMEICPFELSPTKDFLNQLIDTQHQAIFYFRGKSIPTTIIDRLDYSLMLIHPDNACAYCDEGRENSKYRMKFTYNGSNYDFPITDPVFLEQFKKSPDSYADLDGVYLVLSLGIAFEGFHYKLVATVLIPNDLDVTQKPQFIDDSSLSYMEQQKLLYANAYAKWTPKEDAELLELLHKGMSIKELVKKFERNEGAIRSRIKKLTFEQLYNENGFQNDEKELAYLIELKQEIERKIQALREKINLKSQIQ